MDDPVSMKGTLKRAWMGYRAAVADAAEHQDAAEQFEASRSEAERYAQIVNEVHQRLGQEPMSFDRLSEFNAVSPVELSNTPTNEENTMGFRAVVAWSERTVSGVVGDRLIIPWRSLVERMWPPRRRVTWSG